METQQSAKTAAYRSRSVILAIDVGSSSVRCTAYDAGAVVSADDSDRSDRDKSTDDPADSLEVLASSSQARRSVHPSTGQIALENDDGTTLLDIIDMLVDDVLRKLQEKCRTSSFQVIALGFSSLVMNLVGVDRNGKLIGDSASMSYACSSTAEVIAEVQDLKRELGDQRLKKLCQKTGAPIHAAYALAQLRVWYRRQAADQGNGQQVAVATWQTIASACLCRWTGQTALPISYSEASWTGLLNVQTCEYEPTILELLPLECRDALPTLADYDMFTTNNIPNIPVLGLTDERESDTIRPFLCLSKESASSMTTLHYYHDRWPALRQARLFLGLGDGACANIGSKCAIPCRIACTVGTSAAARICLPLALQSPTDHDATLPIVVPPGLFCYRIDRSHVLIGGALTDGGSVVEWIANLLNRPVESASFAECLQQADELLDTKYTESANTTAVTITSTPLTVIPFFSGERSTGFRSGATGAMLGLTLETTPAHVMMACLEGVTLRLNAIVQLILQTIASSSPVIAKSNIENEPVRIVCSGRALEVNALWRRMLADCTGLGIVLDEDTTEGSSRGVAALLLAALRQSDSRREQFIDYGPTDALSATTTSSPNPISRTYWDKATQRQELCIGAVCHL